jgi:hypothetical protein
LATEQVDVVMIVDGQALIPAGHAPIREGDQIITSPLPMAIAGMPLRQANSTSASPVESSRVGDKSK